MLTSNLHMLVNLYTPCDIHKKPTNTNIHTYITHAHTHTDAHTHTAGWETKSSVNTIILCWTCLLTTAVPQGVAYSKFVKKKCLTVMDVGCMLGLKVRSHMVTQK